MPRAATAPPPARPAPDLREAPPERAGEPAPSSATANAGPPALPAGLTPGAPSVVRIPGDAPARVIEGGPETRRAIIYLHGVCGDITAIDGWAEAASQVGTVIALRGDARCDRDRFDWAPRFSWGPDLANLERRIDRALEVIRAERGGALDEARPILFGYSQGVVRALALAKRDPRRFPLVILGGPPVQASPAALARARAVAILRGEFETRDNADASVTALDAAGTSARLFVLPRAGHGSYGPESNRVLGDVFSWLLEQGRAEPGPSAP